MKGQKTKKISVVLFATTIFVVLNVLIALFRPFLNSFLSIILYELFFFLLAIVFFIMSVVYAFSNFRMSKIKALLPLIILIIGIIFLLLIVRGIMPQKIFFTTRESQMMQAVNLVKENKLKVMPDTSAETYTYFYLPDNLKYLSKYKGVGVDTQKDNRLVFFYSYATFGGLKGYIYSENGSEPKRNPRLFGFEYAQIRKLNNNWYSVNLY